MSIPTPEEKLQQAAHVAAKQQGRSRSNLADHQAFIRNVWVTRMSLRLVPPSYCEPELSEVIRLAAAGWQTDSSTMAGTEAEAELVAAVAALEAKMELVSYRSVQNMDTFARASLGYYHGRIPSIFPY
jgi:hypothetical protein